MKKLPQNSQNDPYRFFCPVPKLDPVKSPSSMLKLTTEFTLKCSTAYSYLFSSSFFVLFIISQPQHLLSKKVLKIVTELK